MADATIQISGNLTADPQLKYTPNGKAVCNFQVAVNTSRGEGQDPHVSFYRVSVWSKTGENFAESGRKGMRVVVTGTPEIGGYKDKDGNWVPYVQIVASDVAASCRFGTVAFTKASGSGRGVGGPGQDGANAVTARANGAWAASTEPSPF